MSKVLILIAVLAFCAFLTNGLFISWKLEKIKLTDDNIFIDMKSLYVPGNPSLKLNKKFLNLTTSMTFDERCNLGLPLSMAWLPNQPYSGVNGPKRINNSIGFVAFGIFPGVVNKVVGHCCPASDIIYGKLLKSVRQAEEHLSKNLYDFTFPIYVQRWGSKTYKDQPFIPVVQAPRVILVVFDDVQVSKTSLLADTIFSAWPFLLFILGAACAAGIIVWALEKISNSNEFTTLFLEGTWDGFWWAVVTMTTVGYGDKAPRTVLGRLFCLIWIIVGINIIASFTALVTATVTANTRPYFNVIGAKIGAVNGSEEFRVGVTLNADMRGFKNPSTMTKALKRHDIDGMLIDNYALTRFSHFLEDEENKLRLESTIEHRIVYGMVLPSGSTKTEKCVRRYMTNYHHEIFSTISKQLKPLRRKGSSKSDYSVQAAGGLFHQEVLFKLVVRNGIIVVAGLILIGLLWDYFYRRPKTKTKGDAGPVKVEEKLADGNQDLVAIERKRKALMAEHRKFQCKWIDQLSSLSSIREK